MGAKAWGVGGGGGYGSWVLSGVGWGGGAQWMEGVWAWGGSSIKGVEEQDEWRVYKPEMGGGEEKVGGLGLLTSAWLTMMLQHYDTW